MKRLNHLSLFSVERGFTIIELMIVVGIMSILAAIAIPAIQKYTFDAKEAEATQMLLSAWRDQQRVKMDCEAGRYEKCSGLYTDALDSTDPTIPTLMVRPASSHPHFNLITGGIDPNIAKKMSLDELGYNLTPPLNVYGMKIDGYDINGDPIFSPGKFMMGAEGYINGKSHFLVIDERGTLKIACNARTNYRDPSFAAVYLDFASSDFNCQF